MLPRRTRKLSCHMGILAVCAQAADQSQNCLKHTFHAALPPLETWGHETCAKKEMHLPKMHLSRTLLKFMSQSQNEIALPSKNLAFFQLINKYPFQQPRTFKNFQKRHLISGNKHVLSYFILFYFS